MKTTPQDLLKDTLETAFPEMDQERLLANTLKVARARRRRRFALNSLIVVSIGFLVGQPLVRQMDKTSDDTNQIVSKSETPDPSPDSEKQFLEGTRIRLVSDQELLAAIGTRPAVILGNLNDGAIIFLDSQ